MSKRTGGREASCLIHHDNNFDHDYSYLIKFTFLKQSNFRVNVFEWRCCATPPLMRWSASGKMSCTLRGKDSYHLHAFKHLISIQDPQHLWWIWEGTQRSTAFNETNSYWETRQKIHVIIILFHYKTAMLVMNICVWLSSTLLRQRGKAVLWRAVSKERIKAKTVFTMTN